LILFVSFRDDIEIPDEETEEEIIRRQRLRREQLKKVKNEIFPPPKKSPFTNLISHRN
jgi:MoxR-like ATPase